MFFYFKILYKKGKENLVVDSLSRKDEGNATLCSILVVILEGIKDVQAEYVKSPEIRTLIEEVGTWK